ncbi:FAD-dependent oxidoreductase [Rhodovibrio salinarum]|uniref:2,4-dienoyl-CoA reductase n=1 Tax=Rhodovibrio salinarum TaxID=1087 RepID=A0A934V186_9PROT|nr:NADH:flavin oxidoreductase [Rhodovibrio salinarum]MBK1699147.1 hypothetical protein [Rhodovibrio salinarum]
MALIKMRKNDPLLTPLTIGPLVLRNRVMSTSHALGFVNGAMPDDRYKDYHEAKARGGIALTMFGGSASVSPDSGSVFGQIDLNSDAVVPHLAEMAERIHGHGAAAMCQLTHLGGRSHWRADNWLPTIAPSRYREPRHRGFARAMDRADIDRVVRDFGEAGRRCREAGLDGVELHVTSHLIGQFWSPEVNQRTDDFGGSLEKRCRFGLMALEAVREAAGDGMLVGIRMAVGDGEQAALPDEEYAEIARLHDTSGLVDFFNLSHGRIDTEIGLSNYMPGMHLALAPQLAAVGKFKSFLSRPVFHAARINDLATARHAISEGLVDMVGMTRAHIADPEIVAKIEADEEERIRPCVGATYCSWQRRCIHNVSVGNEMTLPHEIAPAERARRVVVVGAGPGGLEAARVAAVRGHHVTVFEAAPEAGGQLRLAARMPRRRDLIGIVDWRVAELGHLGVEIRYNTYAEAEDIEALAPDVVILATGGLPDTLEDTLGEDAPVGSVWELLETLPTPSGDLLFYDAVGTVAGASVAEMLAESGQDMTFVTPDDSFGKEMSYLERPHVKRALYRAGTAIHPDLRLVSCRRSGNRVTARFVNEYTGAETEIEADRLVIERGTYPLDELFFELAPRSRNAGAIDPAAMAAARPQPVAQGAADTFELYRIGDAVSSRDVHAAMLDANRICRAI